MFICIYIIICFLIFLTFNENSFVIMENMNNVENLKADIVKVLNDIQKKKSMCNSVKPIREDIFKYMVEKCYMEIDEDNFENLVTCLISENVLSENDEGLLFATAQEPTTDNNMETKNPPKNASYIPLVLSAKLTTKTFS